MKFNVGDRIRFGGFGEGVIKFIDDSDNIPYAVEFDDSNVMFHDCDGHTKDKYGYWCEDSNLELIEKRRKNESNIVWKRRHEVSISKT